MCVEPGGVRILLSGTVKRTGSRWGASALVVWADIEDAKQDALDTMIDVLHRELVNKLRRVEREDDRRA